MRIGIVTIAESMNYGQRLQNYAVEQILLSLGHKPETIMNGGLSLLCPAKQRLILKLNILLRRGLYNTGRRALSFDKFIRRRMHFSKDMYPDGDFTSYDMLVLGSDQLWNVCNPWIDAHKDFFFAQFFPPERCVAFSASLGTNDFSDEQLRYITEKVDAMKAVSVREQSGADLLRQHCKRPIEVTADPVLLLSAEKWRSVARRPSFLKKDEPYLLTYFIGDVPQKTETFIRRVAEALSLRVISLQGVVYDKRFSDLYFGVGPEEFLYLMAHSTLTLTDSFHACAFSCIFKRPFRWFSRTDRASTNARMENVFSMFSIGDWAVGDTEESAEHCLECSFDAVDDVLAREKEHALDYLRRALTRGGDEDA